VATLGTSLTRDHLRLLRRFADEVLVLFDSDSAGMAAAERGLDLFFEEELPARVVTLEAGLDPCDYLMKRGPEAFAERLGTSVDLFEFKLAAVRSAHNLDTAHGRRAAVRALMETVGRVSDPIMAAELRRRAAEAYGLPEEVLAAELSGRRQPGRRTEEPAGEDEVQLSRRRKAERELVWALLAWPQALFDASAALESFERVVDPAAREVLVEAARVYEGLGEMRLEEVATSLGRQDAVALVADFASGLERYRPSDPEGSAYKVLGDLRRIDLEDEKTRLTEEMRLAAPERQAEIADRIAEIQRELQNRAARPAEVADRGSREE
jgi:DNA primase